MPRLGAERFFVETALKLALRSTCERGQVGALIVRDKRIISTGFNGAPPGQPHCLDVGCLPGPDGGCTRTTHAEANAVAFSSRHGIAADVGTMYCTHSMCATCAALVVAAGIVEVVYLHAYRLTEGLELLDKCNVRVRQYG